MARSHKVKADPVRRARSALAHAEKLVQQRCAHAEQLKEFVRLRQERVLGHRSKLYPSREPLRRRGGDGAG